MMQYDALKSFDAKNVRKDEEKNSLIIPRLQSMFFSAFGATEPLIKAE